MNENVEIRVERTPIWRGNNLEFLILADQKGDEGKRFYASLSFNEIRPNEDLSIDKMNTLSSKAAQQLADDLWKCGIRPSEGMGSAGALKKTEDHLKDMRKITFNVLEIESDK